MTDRDKLTKARETKKSHWRHERAMRPKTSWSPGTLPWPSAAEEASLRFGHCGILFLALCVVVADSGPGTGPCMSDHVTSRRVACHIL